MSTPLDLSAESAAANVSFSGTGDFPPVITAKYSIGGGAETTVVDVDSVIGTAFDDAFLFRLGFGTTFHFNSLTGGAGRDTLRVTGRASIDLTGVTGIESFVFNNTGLVTLTDANLVGISGPISINLAAGNFAFGLSFDASGVGASHQLIVNIAVNDSSPVTGGGGDDIFIGSLLNGAVLNLHGGLGHDGAYVTESVGIPFLGSGAPNGYYPLAFIDGVEFYQLAGYDAVEVKARNFVGVTGGMITVAAGATGGDISGVTLDASQQLMLIGSVERDRLIGGAADDAFVFRTGQLNAIDVVIGGAGHDVLINEASGVVHAEGVSGVEFYSLKAGSANSLTLVDANFADVTGFLGVAAGNGASIDASAVSASHGVFLGGGSGVDTFLGGAGGDVFQFSASTLTAADTVTGGGGADLLTLISTGTIDVSGVSQVEFYQLASGGSNSLTLSDLNLAGLSTGVLGVQAGSGGDTLSAGGVAVSNQVYLFGGAGDDTLVGGGGATVLSTGGGTDTLIGGSGADAFSFGSAEGSTVQNFTSGVDVLFFSDAVFDLGVNEGQGAGVGFDRVDPSLLSGNTDGTFTSTGQRFAFDAASSQLFYAESGSATAVGDIHVVAILDGVTTLHATDLFFGV